MSSSLVRKSLELFDDDFVDRDSRRKAKKSSSLKPSKVGVHRQLKPKTKKQQHGKHTRKLKTKDKYKSNPDDDHTEKNIKLLQRLTEAAKTEELHTVAVFGHKSEETLAEMKEEESTLFTEEDFKKFEQEYNIH